MKNLTKYWWLLLLGGMGYIALGTLVMQYPEQAILGATYYIAFSLLFIGITQTIFGFMGDRNHRGSGFTLVMGIIDICLAIYLLNNPIASAETFVLIIGFWILFKGIIETTNAFEMKKLHKKQWWINLLSGIALIVVGWMIAGNPISGSLVAIFYLSISFYIKGFTLISSSFIMKRTNK
jgi:uncharacterized membrane protein HdeD (DUF308 family)